MTAEPNRTPLVNLPAAWRYSLKQLLIATAMIAVGCVALRNASSMWIAAMFGVTLVVLLGASLCAVFRAGRHRAFWIGFAAAGWLYVVVLMYGWNLDDDSHIPLSSRRLATTRLSRWSHEKWFPIITRQVATRFVECRLSRRHRACRSRAMKTAALQRPSTFRAART